MDKNSIDFLILQNLIYNEEFTRKVVRFVENDYFQSDDQKLLTDTIKNYVNNYNSMPTRNNLWIEINSKKGVRQETLENMKTLLASLKRKKGERENDLQWLVDQTESWCKKRAMQHAMMQSIEIFQNNKIEDCTEEITNLMNNATRISFNTDTGHDYFKDAGERHDYYNREESKIPFDIDLLNRATNGGVSPGTLNLIMAPPGVGKTALMCCLASYYAKIGKNVFYFTLEMNDKEIAKRIDANLYDTDMDKIQRIPREEFVHKIQEIGEGYGKIKIKRYPTTAGSVGDFKSVVAEARIKEDFVPDIIFVDYLGIASSSRIKANSGASSYNYLKAVSEEFAGFAQELDVPLWSGIQPKRESFNSEDMTMADIAESIGISHTADFLMAVMRQPDPRTLKFKVIKNRYNSLHDVEKFYVGVNMKRSRFFNVDNDLENDELYDDQSYYNGSHYSGKDESSEEPEPSYVPSANGRKRSKSEKATQKIQENKIIHDQKIELQTVEDFISDAFG